MDTAEPPITLRVETASMGQRPRITTASLARCAAWCAAVWLTACQMLAPTPTTVALSAPPSESLPDNFLHVEGQNIVNKRGEIIHLRGVNFDNFYDQYQWNPAAPEAYATSEDFRRLSEIGVTVVRVAIHWRFLETDLAFDLIDRYVEAARDTGIYLVIDMHVAPPGEFARHVELWPDLSAQQRFIELWQRIAREYRDEPSIAGYDLYHEPNPPREEDWWALAGRIIEAIRQVDPYHIIFLQRPTIPGASFQRISDPNVVYTFHDYEPVMVSFAASGQFSDVPLPATYNYPGEVATGTTFIGRAEEAILFTDRGADEWLPWESGPLTPPHNAEWATVVIFGRGDIGDNYFDELRVYVNNELYQIPNPGFEAESPHQSRVPASWRFYQAEDASYAFEWVSEAAFESRYGLEVRGHGDWFEIRQGTTNLLTDEYIPVPANSTLTLSVWLNPLRNQGELGVTVDWYKATYEQYDINRLRANILPYVEWARINQVPLWVGEFGATSLASGFSGRRLVSDKIALYNEYGLGWALWTYRESEFGEGFGLYVGPIEKTTEHSRLNEALYRLLADGLTAAP